MSTEIVTLPYIGTLTAMEVHAAVIGFVVFFLIGISRASIQIRHEPWYFLGAALVGLLLGVVLDGWV